MRVEIRPPSLAPSTLGVMPMEAHRSRPRWGTFSVLGHRDLKALAIDILLYDRLVFPSPVPSIDEEDWTDADRERLDRWKARDRDELPDDEKRLPDLLLGRAKEAQDLIHFVIWDGAIRAEWQERWELLTQTGNDVTGLAMGLTPYVLSLRAYADANAGPRASPPIPIAAYRAAEGAIADIELRRSPERALARPLTEQRSKLHRDVGLLFHRMLEMPVTGNPPWAYQKAVELSHDPAYRAARRALYDWEDERIREEWPTATAIKELQDIVIEHDILVQRAFDKTWKRRFYRIARFGFAGAAELVGHLCHVPGAGVASDVLLEVVEAKFPQLDEKPGSTNASPGAALSSAISVLTHT